MRGSKTRDFTRLAGRLGSLGRPWSQDLLTAREKRQSYAPGFTTLLLTLQRVPDVFEEAFRPYRFRVARSPQCLICQEGGSVTPQTTEELDVALDQALARLGNE